MQVYMFLSQNKRLIKIGRSYESFTRIKQHQTSSPYIIKPIVCFIANEREIHRKFSHLRKHGEWFSYTKEIQDYVNKINSVRRNKTMVDTLNLRLDSSRNKKKKLS